MASLLGNTAANSKKKLQQWQAIRDTVFDLIGLGIENETSCNNSDVITTTIDQFAF